MKMPNEIIDQKCKDLSSCHAHLFAEVDGAAALAIVLAEGALRLKAAQRPG